MNDIEVLAAQKFSGIIENLKKQAHQPLNDPERESAVDTLKKNWNAPQRHLQRAVDRLKYPQWAAKLDTLKPMLGKGVLIGIFGTNGSGKTQMAVELMKHQVEQNLKSARFCDAMEIFLSLKATFNRNSNTTEDDVLAAWSKPKLLVIDEAHERAETEWENRIVTTILDRRYRALKDTILIMNLTPQAARKSLGDSVWQRMNESGGVIEATWGSFR